MSEILVPVSFGELLDKIAILQIKSERMSDPAKLANVRNELSALDATWSKFRPRHRTSTPCEPTSRRSTNACG